MACAFANSMSAGSPTCSAASYPGPLATIERANVSGSANSQAKGTVALDLFEPVRFQQRLAGAGSAERDHGGLVGDLGRRQPSPRAERPRAGRGLDVPPDGDAEAATRAEHAEDLGDGVRRRGPHAAEARGDVERRVGPGQRAHVAHADVGVRAAVSGDSDEPRRRVDAGAVCAPDRSELDGQARSAGDVQQMVAGVDAEVVVHGHVLAAVRRLAERGEVHRGVTPAAIDDGPVLALGVRRMHRRRVVHHQISIHRFGLRALSVG